MDLNSTFGVYVSLPNSNSPSKLNPNEWMEVKCNSTIVFGSLNHWVLGWQDIPVLVSGNVNPDRKKRLHSLLDKLGATVCHDWHPDVMFLVMDKIAFTQKVCLSLYFASLNLQVLIAVLIEVFLFRSSKFCWLPYPSQRSNILKNGFRV